MFTYGSVCSGIEAVTCAWHSFAKPLWFSEIEPFPSAVLQHHYPNVLNLGNMLYISEKIISGEIEAPDVLVAGTPCQAFSVAGLRLSLEDERGNLTLELIKILESIDYVRFNQGKQPCVLLWENVPGVLSTKDNAFGHFLAGLVQEDSPLQPTGRKWSNAGYVHSKRTVCWRTLDAQYFGVAQRRKRVFLIASARRESVSKILFEQKSMSRNIKKSKIEEYKFTCFTESSFNQYKQSTIAGTLKASGGALSGGSENFIVHGSQDPIVSKVAHCIGRNNGLENILFTIKGKESVRIYDVQNKSPTLISRMGTGGNNVPCLAIAGNIINRKPENGCNGKGFSNDISYTLTKTDQHAVMSHDLVRKLTPVECERLQGFPDDYTQINWRGKKKEQCPDSHRYKAIGNSMAVPVMKFLGERISDYFIKNRIKHEHRTSNKRS